MRPVELLVLIVVDDGDDGLRTRRVHGQSDGHGRVTPYRRDSQTPRKDTKA